MPKPDAGPAWVQAARGAMRREGLTQRQLAYELHVADRTLRDWFGGISQPDPAKLGPLADRLRISRLWLFEQLGWIPSDEAAGIERLTLAVNSLELLDYFDTAMAAGPELLVRHALRLGCEAHVFIETRTVENIGPGPSRIDIDYRAYVGLSRRGIPASERTGHLTEYNRPLRRDMQSAARIAPALIEDNVDKRAKYQALARSELWMWCPLILAASRPENPNAIDNRTETILVVGDHGSGADLIAALISKGIGWGHANTSFQAQRAYGRISENQATHAEHCALVAKAYLQPPRSKSLVIGHGNPATVAEVLRSVSDVPEPNSVLVVYPRGDADLTEYARRVWRARPDPTQDQLGRPHTYQCQNDEAIDALRGLGVNVLTRTSQLRPHARLTMRPEDQRDVDLTSMHWAVYNDLPDWLHGDRRTLSSAFKTGTI